ncbi:E3 ubiquitin protein ligase RIN2 [Sesamum angolense]|uniref:E3 ubiquitin protein ligase RIN2 n=1 Tax=Sesamum angolense TaxID=2727404 RepID=A0AAE1W1S0_9LAMI|nr:E3 ubiquitin protein ligase RIN2 [Sesamum angolense]
MNHLAHLQSYIVADRCSLDNMKGSPLKFLTNLCFVLLSLVGLQYWTDMSLEKYKSDGLIVDDFINSEDASHAKELLLGSYTTLALVASFALNVFILIILSLKTIFFSELYTSEIRKMLERLLNYVIYKEDWNFSSLSSPTNSISSRTMVNLVRCFKLWLGIFERLNASPSATPWTYFRVYSALLLVLSVDLLCDFDVSFALLSRCIISCGQTYLVPSSPMLPPIFLFPDLSLGFKLPCAIGGKCYFASRHSSSSMFLLLFFEPLSIAFETLQAIVVHGFQLLEIWLHHSAGDGASCRLSKIFDVSLLVPWGSGKASSSGILAFPDMMTMLMALALSGIFGGFAWHFILLMLSPFPPEYPCKCSLLTTTGEGGNVGHTFNHMMRVQHVILKRGSENSGKCIGDPRSKLAIMSL